ETRTADQPESCLAVLDAIETLAPDPEAVTAARLRIPEPLVQKQPDNVELLSRLVVIYHRQKKRDRCLAVLEPQIKRLGSTEGARILGLIYFESGKSDEALALLQPYADKHLQAAVESAAAIRAAQDSLVNDLKNGTAKDFDYARAEKASAAERTKMIGEY